MDTLAARLAKLNAKNAERGKPTPVAAKAITYQEVIAPDVKMEPFIKMPEKPVDFDSPVFRAKHILDEEIYSHIDAVAAQTMTRDQLKEALRPILPEILNSRIALSQDEVEQLLTMVLDEMTGFGPLEPLLADETINDILVNGAYQVYIERKGVLELSQVRFKDETHLRNIAVRIATRVGRHIDERTPMVDARLPDGSRVNIITSPLSLIGTVMSIRKFSRKAFTLQDIINNGGCSSSMANALAIFSQARCNLIVSGGTGSGKTTLLNALSGLIDSAERIVTIEDAAELRLGQPHVVPLETRNASVDGSGRVSIRDLFVNALRMRPDRIIVGEVRSDEAYDMLNAMNTGHDGSLGTIHANSPRDAIMRLENMVSMANGTLSQKTIRQQIASAVDVIVQVARLKSGARRIISITEATGVEGDMITMHELFGWDHTKGFTEADILPRCWHKIEAAGLDHHYREHVFGRKVA